MSGRNKTSHIHNECLVTTGNILLETMLKSSPTQYLDYVWNYILLPLLAWRDHCSGQSNLPPATYSYFNPLDALHSIAYITNQMDCMLPLLRSVLRTTALFQSTAIKLLSDWVAQPGTSWTKGKTSYKHSRDVIAPSHVIPRRCVHN